MATADKSLLLILILIQVANGVPISKAYEGCKYENPYNRMFRAIGSDYKPSQLKHEVCYESCDKHKYRFAALTEGRFCMCASNIDGMRNSSLCSLRCPGEKNQSCGGRENAQIYRLPGLLRVTYPPGVVKAHWRFTIRVGHPGDSGTRLWMESGDGFVSTSSPHAYGITSFTHTYMMAGEYDVTFKGNSSYRDYETVTYPVKVESEVKGVIIKCPPYVEKAIQFKCNITVIQGSNIRLDIKFDEREAIALTPLASTIHYTIGSNERTSSYDSSYPYSVRYLFLDDMITKESTLVAFEYNARTSTDMYFEVWRPDCGNQLKFCYLKYACIGYHEDCTPRSDGGYIRCSGNTAYSLSSKSCIDKVSGKPVKTPVQPSSERLNILRVLIWSRRHYSDNSLTYHAPVGNQPRVQPGDVIAVSTRNGSISMTRHESGAFRYYFSQLSRYNEGTTERFNSYSYSSYRPSVKFHLINPSLPSEFKHTYCHTGRRRIKARVSNLFSTESNYTDVKVALPIKGTRIVTLTEGLEGQLHKFTAHTVQGNFLSFKWKFSEELTETQSQSRNVSHTFTLRGIYTVKLEVYNGISSQTAFFDVRIIEPVMNLLVEGEITIFNHSTQVSWTISKGENVTYDVTMGDGQRIIWRYDGSLETNATLQQTYRNATSGRFLYLYMEVGYYTLNVNASNQLSWKTSQATVAVQNLIQSFSIVHPVVLPLREKTKVFLDLRGGSFVTLNAYFNGHRLTEYQLKENDSYVVVPADYLDTVMTATLTCSPTNLVSAEHTSTIHVKVQRRISGMHVSCSNPVIRNNTVSCLVNLGAKDTQACYRLDLASRYESVVFYGNESQCQTSFQNPGSVSVPPNGLITYERVYYELGRHFVILTAVNLLSKEQKQFLVSVTKGACYPPSVDIKGPNLCAGGKCKNNGTLTVKRSEMPEFYSNVVVNCTYSNTGYFMWRVFTHPENEEITDLRNTLASGIGLDKLNLDIRALWYGLYRLELNVSVVDEEDLQTLDSLLLNVVKTKLIGGIVGGRIKRVKWGVNYTFDAETSTSDPDLWNTTDKTDMEFKWFCKRKCENWPKFGPHYELLNTSFTHNNCSYARGHEGGCVRFLTSYPGPLPNVTGGQWTVDTFFMYEEESIDLMVVVMKDTRTLVMTQAVNIITGDPPDIFIKCRTNCGRYMNPSSRFSVESVIKNYRRGMELEYLWTITMDPGHMTRTRPPYPYPWKDKATTGTVSANLALQPNTFFRNTSLNFFLIEVLCSRVGSTATGIGTFEFYLNDLPVPGNCSVTPAVGQALETEFLVSCSEFLDDQGIQVYQISSQVDGKPSIIHYTGKDLSAAEPFSLPMGLEMNNYSVQIQVKATDKYGSYVYINCSVQVLPVPPETTAELLENVTSSTDYLTNILNELPPSKIPQTVATLCAVLNTASLSSGNDTAENSTQAAERVQQENLKMMKVKDLMVTALENSKTVTLNDLEEFSSVLATVTFNTEQISEASVGKGAEYVEGMIKALHKINRDNDPPAETMEHTGTYVLNCIGNLMKSTVGIKESKPAADNSESTNITKVRTRLQSLKDMVLDISETVMSRKVAGEADSVLSSPTLNLSVVKQFTKRLANTDLKIGGDSFFTVPSNDAMFGDSNATTDYLQAKVVSFPSNPYIWSSDANETTIISMVRELSMDNDTDQEVIFSDLPQPFAIFLPRTSVASSDETIMTNTTRLISEGMQIYRVTMEPKASLHIKIYLHKDAVRTNHSEGHSKEERGNRAVRWLVYVKQGNAPNDVRGGYDYRCVLPLPSKTEYKKTNLTDVRNSTNAENTTSDRTVTPQDTNTCHVIPNISTEFDIFFGIRQVFINKEDSDEELEDDDLETLMYGESPYIMQVYSSKCVWFDTVNETWSTEGCTVGPATTAEITQCLCNHLTSFGSSFTSFQINTFDFANPFANLNENPAVLATMITILGIYFLFLIWARKKDKLDVLKAGVTPLLDNNPRDKYLYEILVCTGARKGAGTTAKVCIVLSGDQAETEPRLLWDDKRPVLQTSAVDAFLMAVPNPLGDLSHLRVWHDNSGESPSWFFSRMQLTDLQTGVKYFFICDRWLAVEEDDGQVDRVLPVAGISELTDFNHLFWRRTQRDLADNHIWFSVFKRPARSTFTRVQRLTCCLCLIFCSMMANIFFYKTDEMQSPGSQVYKIGPIRFSMTQLITGFLAGLMVFPANVLIVAIFRYAKPKQIQAFYINKTWSKTTKEENHSKVIESELKQQIEYLETDDLGKLVLATPSTPTGLQTGQAMPTVEIKHLKPPVITQPSQDKRKKKCTCYLPWWFSIIGYALSVCCVGVALWMTVGVASSFGKKKSEEWLVSFGVSVLESVFLLQPVKVLCIALFYALIIRDPATEENEHENPEVKEDETLLHVPVTETEVRREEKAEDRHELKKSIKIPSPPNEKHLEEYREKRFKEIQMRKIIREVILYLAFLFILMIVGYTYRDPGSFYVYRSLSSTFSTYGSNKLEKVNDRNSFWAWVSNSLLPGLYSTHFYDGNSYKWQKGLVADNQGYLIGEPRLRQLRIKPGVCLYPVTKLSTECHYGYSIWSQDEESYMEGWKSMNKNSTDEPDPAWTYRSASDLDTYPYWGRHSTYSGGGYVATLGKTMRTAQATLQLLKNSNWIDNRTRVLFVEFLIFNPNVNLFIVSMISFEIPEIGAIYPYFKMYVMRLNRYVGEFMFFVMAMEVSALLFIIFYLVSHIKKIIKEKLGFFKKFWNVFELMLLGLCVSAVVMFVFRENLANSLSSRIRENPTSHQNFESAALMDEIYVNLLGLIVFLANLKCLHLLRFNRRISILGSTLQYAARPLLQFSVVFFIVFLSFAQLAYLVFSSTVIDFSSFIKTMETLSVQMLRMICGIGLKLCMSIDLAYLDLVFKIAGAICNCFGVAFIRTFALDKFDFNKMVKADRVFGPTVFFFFALIVSFILLNFFVTIVIEAFMVVKHDVSKQSNEYEIVDFIIDRFKNAMGLGGKTKKEAEYVHFVYMNQQKIAILQKRLDEFYELLESPDWPQCARKTQPMMHWKGKMKKRKIATSV